MELNRERKSLADQLAGAVVTDHRGKVDGVRRKDGGIQRSGGFIALVEDVVPGVNKLVEHPQPIDIKPHTLGKRTVDTALSSIPFVPAKTPDDAMAREACAAVEERMFGWQTASFRRHGCYDGDPDHQIALEAIRLTREAKHG